MGREIRRVIPNWEHPKRIYPTYRGFTEERYIPLFDGSYLEAISEWIKNHLAWEKGEHPDQRGSDCAAYKTYAEWAGDAPRRNSYRPDWKPEEMTWYQVYETVSEGTPVTPPFATREELVEYLVENGDSWDQRRRREGGRDLSCKPWSREQAVAFVFGSGWAPTLIIEHGVVKKGVEACK